MLLEVDGVAVGALAVLVVGKDLLAVVGHAPTATWYDMALHLEVTKEVVALYGDPVSDTFVNSSGLATDRQIQYVTR